MPRLTRAEQQERTRGAVLAAARAEFAEHGFTAAKVDRVADRAELTRGAVYSNFAGKRALYLAVLVDVVERARDRAGPPATPPASTGAALAEFARVWLERLPFVGDAPGSGHLQLRSLSGVVEDGPARDALAALVRFEALLLGLALEARRPGAGRRVRTAGLALTLLAGAAAVAENAPGVGDPFDLVRAAEHLAGIAIVDDDRPPYLDHVAPAETVDQPWAAPRGLVDEISGRPAEPGRDGVLVALGVHRLAAAEDTLRSARLRDEVTVAIVTDDPAELGRLARLARLRIVDIAGCLRRVFAPADLPRLRVVLDDGAVAAALGVDAPGTRTEVAVRVRGGRVVARAEGFGAGHAVAASTALPRA
ncbi:TetR/AcrR family transcriptional regulator [Pseudonocardia kongjuensis]|uniref:TetR/AcrR family transcriptional regulator n=1 Tax=Pseudonocardia kongjuensis TaxID=102227 RepID=A0ABN1XM42_9PSEU